MASLKELSSTKMFGGFNKRFQHTSSSLGCEMKFTVYFPPLLNDVKIPVIYWLSGLTCTDENFIQKSGAQQYAAKHEVALVAPDTSPRGLNVEGESESWDFGVGAGFYLNATVSKWKNWRMYDYITSELPELIKVNFSQLDTSKASIMGHSMGGHGALTIFLKKPESYKSVSAFAPICNPTRCPWGVKAFSGYLGEDRSTWNEYDATELVKNARDLPSKILIDQGSADSFLSQKQLLPENFVEVAKQVNVDVEYRLQKGYDHSYFFIASFVGEHIAFHAKHLTR